MTQEALKRVAEKLRRTGASIPAPELTGTIEGSVVTGLCIALALVEAEIEALAQPEQEPVAWWNNTGTHIDLNVSSRGTPLYTHPPQRVEQKMVMWPCLIDTADFSKGTVTIVMQCDDYKVSAGTHWLSTIPPEENT
jgi:hypothetical protein